jgi:hypothetical protein
MSLTQVNPSDVFFTFSRLRPKFSCGRRVQDTLDAILNKNLRAEDLPPINVLVDPATGHMFSLNNRRLYVFKALQAAARLETIPVRIKPVPQTKRMKDKYTADKCVKKARLMLEREAVELLVSNNKVEGVNSDEEDEDGVKDSDEASRRKRRQ